MPAIATARLPRVENALSPVDEKRDEKCLDGDVPDTRRELDHESEPPSESKPEPHHRRKLESESKPESKPEFKPESTESESDRAHESKPNPEATDKRPDTAWVADRDAAVFAATTAHDEAALRRLAARPGGFGSASARRAAWMELLHVDRLAPADRGVATAAGAGAGAGASPDTANAGTAGPTATEEPQPQPQPQTDPGSTGAETPDTVSTFETDMSTATDATDATGTTSATDTTCVSGTTDATEATDATDATDATVVYAPHPDEGQVLLDTRRAFVAYPRPVSSAHKSALQEDLHALIVAVLQRHPRLSYFQGLHDIMTVLYLTLLSECPRAGSDVDGFRSRALSRAQSRAASRAVSRAASRVQSRVHSRAASPAPDQIRPEAHLDGLNLDAAARSHPPPPSTRSQTNPQAEWDVLVRAAEVVCLCRMRDAMGKGLGPMMGMLRLLRRLLAVADPQLYRISSSISPVPTLPFFALSWILTLFSHDVDTLEPVQRIFDYLISRNPISAIYLAVAILVAKKPQMMRLAAALGPEARRDPSLLHPLFARLPPLYADTPANPVPPEDWQTPDPKPHHDANPYTPIPLSTVFSLADGLQEKYPWDGPVIRGYEVLGPGSVVNTYAREYDDEPEGSSSDTSSSSGSHSVSSESKPRDSDSEPWTLAAAEAMIDTDVIVPGGDALDDDEAEEAEEASLNPPPTKWTVAPRQRSPLAFPLRALGLRMHLSADRLGTAVAITAVVLGVGAALFGWRSHRHAASGLTGWARWWALVVEQWLAKSRVASGVGAVAAYLPQAVRDAMYM